MEPGDRTRGRINPNRPQMTNVRAEGQQITAMEAVAEDSGRGSGVRPEEKFQISRERMRELFACASDICTVLDEYGVASVEGCCVRKYVEELWRLK